MNSLSWFLYFADVIGNLQGLLTLFAVLGGVISVFTCLGWLMNLDIYGEQELTKTLGGITKKLAPAVAIAALVAAAIPSKETVYMIAGSEAGEFVVNTPEAKEIMTDIKEVIRYQLDQLKTNNNNDRK